jgi:excisionase family DNA binding protein
MSRADVAHWLGVSVGAVDGYCKAEELPFRKVGRRVLFRRSDVNQWFSRRGGNGRGGRGGARESKV